MQSHEELLTVIRDLKAARRAKQKEEKKEAAHLEELKLRLQVKSGQQRKDPKRHTRPEDRLEWHALLLEHPSEHDADHLRSIGKNAKQRAEYAVWKNGGR